MNKSANEDRIMLSPSFNGVLSIDLLHPLDFPLQDWVQSLPYVFFIIILTHSTHCRLLTLHLSGASSHSLQWTHHQCLPRWSPCTPNLPRTATSHKHKHEVVAYTIAGLSNPTWVSMAGGGGAASVFTKNSGTEILLVLHQPVAHWLAVKSLQLLKYTHGLQQLLKYLHRCQQQWTVVGLSWAEVQHHHHCTQQSHLQWSNAPANTLAKQFTRLLCL